MTSQSGGALRLESSVQRNTLVLRPVGELSAATYEQLRDGLLKYAAEEPAAIVVDLGSMHATTRSLLTVFPAVLDRISNWPGVTLVLAAARQPLRTLLDSSAVSRFVSTYCSVPEALESLAAAPRRRRRQVQLPCDPASARLARQLVKQTCHEWDIPEMAADAVVVVSELIDNMVQHARSEGRLRLELRRNMLTVAVADHDARPPQLRVPGLRAAGGRGLVLVDKLSRNWGTAPQHDGGKVVWAVLAVSTRSRANSAIRARPPSSTGRYLSTA
jgi:anti-sigma regulatory factor (Ser/Thr protein kinase)/anti-anti-sigma regulatory factor